MDWELEYIVTVGPVGLGDSRHHWRLDQEEAAFQQFREMAEVVKRDGHQYATLEIVHTPRKGR